MASKSKVCFFFEHKKIRLENRNKLKTFIESIFKKEKKRLSSINYIFCSDKKLLEINRRFLKHDFYTDIITFNLSETNSAQAEIYISVDRVKDNAKKINTFIKLELHRVIFHGVLHLCGYKDKGKQEKVKMKRREDYYLKYYLK